MKPKLILLSDLWGELNPDWIKFYISALNTSYDITYYDCRKLGGIDLNETKESIIHDQFLNGGIEQAVKNLISLEVAPVSVLAFSIGGTIAWKAGLKGLNIRRLYAFSSTRLRYETEKPKGGIHLTFGGSDLFKPKTEWFEKMDLKPTILKHKDHFFYQDKEYGVSVANKLLILNLMKP